MLNLRKSQALEFISQYSISNQLPNFAKIYEIFWKQNYIVAKNHEIFSSKLFSWLAEQSSINHGIFSSLGFYIHVISVYLAFIFNITSIAPKKILCFLEFIMSTNKSFTLVKSLKPRLKKSCVQVKLIQSWKH